MESKWRPAWFENAPVRYVEDGFYQTREPGIGSESVVEKSANGSDIEGHVGGGTKTIQAMTERDD